MLKHLQIGNIAVIRSADIEFGGGFCALTGETGAGKSIIIDSLGLLLGGRAAREIIRTGEERAAVSALFEGLTDETLSLCGELGIECPDDSLLISRTVGADGRSAIRINGQQATLSMLREVGRTLLSIHGQQDNQRLMHKSSHIRLLDAYADLGERLREYSKVFGELREKKKELDSLRGDAAERNRLRDMLSFQCGEIDAARLKPGEEEELAAEALRLGNAERIKKQTDFAYRALHGSERGAVTLLLDRSAAAVGQLSEMIPEAREISSRLEEFRYEIEDIAVTLHRFSDTGEGDPTARLDRIEGRLDLINKLKKKYGADIAEILKFREGAWDRLNMLEDSDARIEELNSEQKELNARAQKLASEITGLRKKSAKAAAAAVCGELAYLDMPGVRFEIRVTPLPSLSAGGADEVEFYIAANPGEPPMPLIKTASGGELSRIMLALKCVLSANDGISTMIFDEVDAGISGKTSRKVGIKLKEISGGAQVLCVTHSAQIASLADEHMKITKTERGGRSEAEVLLLDFESRIDEIARILGGINITEAQRRAAKELIDNRH